MTEVEDRGSCGYDLRLALHRDTWPVGTRRADELRMSREAARSKDRETSFSEYKRKKFKVGTTGKNEEYVLEKNEARNED